MNKHLYVFHHRRVDNGKLFRDLQKRLKSQGIEILKADLLGERYFGGVLFAISFRDGNVSGVIFNTLDPQIGSDDLLVARWSVDDYVLMMNASR